MDISQPAHATGATALSSSHSAPLGSIPFLPLMSSYAKGSPGAMNSPDFRDSLAERSEPSQNTIHLPRNPSGPTPRDDETGSPDESVETVRYDDSLIGAALPGRRAKSKVRNQHIILQRTELHF